MKLAQLCEQVDQAGGEFARLAYGRDAAKARKEDLISAFASYEEAVSELVQGVRTLTHLLGAKP